MKNKNVFKLLLVMGFAFIIFGTSYALFEYIKTGTNNKIIAGDIGMSFNDNNDSIVLTGVFPETKEEARDRDDNYVTFTISGSNESNKDIYYEVDLIHGDNEDGYVRFNDKDLRFDLVEISGSTETIIMDSVSFSEINNSKIWVETIDSGTTNYSKTYKIRMWLSSDVTVSDTYPNATYSASTYKNHYASIKVKVVGDFAEKHLYNVMGTFPATITNQKANITEVYFINDSQSSIDARYNAATIKANVTNTSHSVGTQKLKDMTDYGKVLAWLEDDTNNTGKYILYIGSDGSTYLSTGAQLFCGFSSSLGWSNLSKIDFSNAKTDFVTATNQMFSYAGYDASRFELIGLNKWNTGNVTDMSYMFRYSGYSATTCSLDLSNWDTSNVANMTYMFSYVGNSATTCSLDLSNWNTSNVTNMSYMFFNTGYNMTTTYSLDLGSFDTSSVTDMSGMFNGNRKLKTIYVGPKWDVSNVTNSITMFNNCSSLVGGNGTVYDSNHKDVSYAHVDTAGNPGYLTLKTS